MFDKMRTKKAIPTMSVQEKENLYKLGYTIKELQLTDDEIDEFDKDGMFYSSALGLNIVPEKSGLQRCPCGCGSVRKLPKQNSSEQTKQSETLSSDD